MAHEAGSKVVRVTVPANLRDRRGTIVSPVNSRPGSGWGTRRAEIAQVGPDRLPVLELSMERGLERELTWSFYLGTGSMLEEALRNLARQCAQFAGRTRHQRGR